MKEDCKLFSDVFAGESEENDLALLYEGVSYTRGELRKGAELCAAELVRAGVRRGDHVALWAYNSADWLMALLGIVRLGAVAVLINSAMPRAAVEPLISFCDCGALVYGLNRDTYHHENTGVQLASELGLTGKTLDLRKLCLKERIAAGEESPTLPPEDADETRTAVIIFTTGTTAEPKAVMLSQRGILRNARDAVLHAEEDFCHERACVALPLFHSYGLTVLFSFLLMGKTICLLSRLKSDELIDAVGRYRIGMVASVGILYLGMLSSPRFKSEVAPYVRLCIVGGEFTDPQQIYRTYRAYPEITFAIGYGQTEASPIITRVCAADSPEKRAETVGTPLPGTEIRITTPDGTEQTRGVPGEVLVRSGSLMNGYYRVPPEKQPIDENGWLHTGDLGYLDEDGYLHLTGRIKDIIIKNGENISPAEIERALRSCRGVKEVRVLGAPSPECGEEIEACLTMMEGYRFDEGSVRTQLMHCLIKFKIPANFFVYDTFPLHSNGKLNVQELRSSMLERLEKKNDKA